MRGRCAVYTLTSFFTLSLSGMSLDWAAMATKGLPAWVCCLSLRGRLGKRASYIDRALGHLRVIVYSGCKDACLLRAAGGCRKRITGDGSHRRALPATRRDTPSCSPAPTQQPSCCPVSARVAICGPHCAELCARLSQQPCPAERPHRCRLIDSYWLVAVQRHDSEDLTTSGSPPPLCILQSPSPSKG